MDLETLLTDALAGHAEALPTAPGAWEENTSRVRRDRRRRAVAGGVAASLLVGGAVSAGLLLQRDRPATLQVADPPRGYVVEGYTLLAPAAKVGTVDVDGRSRDVVAFLGRAISRPGRPPSEPEACVAVAEPDGRVTSRGPADPCIGPVKVQGGSALLFELVPLSQSGLPAQPCSYGPMGNLDLALVAPQTTGVTMVTAAGREVAYALVPGTESWPFRLFAGTVPQRELTAGYRLVRGTTVLQDEIPPADATARGCPTTGG